MPFIAMAFFGCNVSNLNLLKYVSMDNQECKVRTKIIGINNSVVVFVIMSMIHLQNCVFLMFLKIWSSKHWI